MAIRWRERRWLRTVVKTVCGIVMVPLVLLGLMIAKSLVGGTPAVFLLDPIAKVTVNGQRSSGWVHFFVRGGWLYLTVNSPRRRDSYSVSLRPSEKFPYPYVSRCAPWTAPRLPMFTQGCTDLWCLHRKAQSESRLVAKPGFVAFDADDGSRVSVRW